jgi:hypothetical protein
MDWVEAEKESAARLIARRMSRIDPQESDSLRQGDIIAHPQRAHRNTPDPPPEAAYQRPVNVPG